MTTENLRDMLKRRFPSPEWCLFFEVTDLTGAMASRRADAIAMNLWPSRGLSINGFEIKVSRSDWLRELRAPEKAEALAKHCDFWWIVAPKGMVSPTELPPTWGLLEADGRGLRITVQAPKQVASMIRRAGEYDANERKRMIDDAVAEIRRKNEERVNHAIEAAISQRGDLAKQVADFEAASGIKIDRYCDGGDLGRAVAVVLLRSGCREFSRYDPLYHDYLSLAGGPVLRCSCSG